MEEIHRKTQTQQDWVPMLGLKEPSDQSHTANELTKSTKNKQNEYAKQTKSNQSQYINQWRQPANKRAA